MTPHELAILDEQALSDWRIVGEATCDLRVTTVLHRDEPDAFNDHCSTYLRCHCCSKYWVATDFVSGRCDIRPMTELEIERYSR